MGRVYDALKRAGASNEAGNNGHKKNATNGSPELHTPAVEGAETSALKQPWDRWPLFSGPNGAGNESASTAHTEEHDGSALPGRTLFGAVGATLDAAGPARAGMEFVSVDISPARVEPHLVAITQPRSAHCERFRSLRTSVLQAGEHKNMKSFVVTSAGVAEGKTLTALNLAWLLAQTDGVTALIIDSDLRQPCATNYLGIDAPVGLSEVLAGQVTLEESIIKLEPAGLHLLPGGTIRDDVAELLSGPRFGAVLDEVHEMFDYIIIDAPPLGIFTDATVLINRADGALLVVRSGKTRYGVIHGLLEQLPRERMLGVVLNRATGELDDSSSYYYQRRYSHADRETVTEEGRAGQSRAEQSRKEVAAVS
jgi:capsular exopolysaccharide synthesis family protein